MTKKQAKRLAKFKKQRYAQAFKTGNYLVPTPKEIRELREYFGLSPVDVAKVLGERWSLKQDTSTVLKWESAIGTPAHLSIPYGAWRLLLSHVGVVEHDEGEQKCK